MKLSLRPWKVSDAEFVVGLRNRPQLMRWFRQDKPLTLHQQRKFMEESAEEWWIAEMNGSPIGVCGRRWLDNSGEMSLVAPFEFHRAVVRALQRKRRPLWGEVFVGNPCLKTYLDCGFKIVGVKERAYYKKDYGLQDVVRIEWRKF